MLSLFTRFFGSGNQGGRPSRAATQYLQQLRSSHADAMSELENLEKEIHNMQKQLASTNEHLEMIAEKEDAINIEREQLLMECFDGYLHRCIDRVEAWNARLAATATAFNQCPADGIARAVQDGIIDGEGPTQVALLLASPGLSLVKIGEYLADRKNTETLVAFLHSQSFADIPLDEALRQLCTTSLALPGESQLIDYMMDHFATQYCEENPEAIPGGKDNAFILSFSLLMLSTDAQRPNSSPKLTLEQWIAQHRGMDFPPDFLEAMYRRTTGPEGWMARPSTLAVTGTSAAYLARFKSMKEGGDTEEETAEPSEGREEQQTMSPPSAAVSTAPYADDIETYHKLLIQRRYLSEQFTAVLASFAEAREKAEWNVFRLERKLLELQDGYAKAQWEVERLAAELEAETRRINGPTAVEGSSSSRSQAGNLQADDLNDEVSFEEGGGIPGEEALAAPSAAVSMHPSSQTGPGEEAAHQDEEGKPAAVE